MSLRFTGAHSSPPVEVRLAKAHQQERRVKSRQHQQNLQEKGISSLEEHSFSPTAKQINQRTPVPSPTQASDSDPAVRTLNMN